MLKWLKKLFCNPETDPVCGCDVYKDKENGSCAHVDGPLCDFPDCSILKMYRQHGRDFKITYFPMVLLGPEDVGLPNSDQSDS